MKIKICGMKYLNNILELSQLHPDYLGFIFYEKSSRFFDGIIPEIPKSIQKVGVFVDASLTEILSKIKKYDLNAVQLHGSETPQFCLELKSQNITVIKAFAVDGEFDFDILKEYENACDFYLFDTKGKLPGGNGTTFDWEILKKYKSNKPFFLSGGIGLDQIKALQNYDTLQSLPLFAIDVNSQFEIEPGLKNINLCTELCNRVHN